MLDVIEVGGQVLFEIPERLFGRDIFWHAEVVDDPAEANGILDNTLGSAVVRWERQGDVVRIRDLTDRSSARDDFAHRGRLYFDARSAASRFGAGYAAQSSAEKFGPIARGIAAADFPPVMQAFPVVANGPGGTAVIDVTDVFLGDIAGFSYKRAAADQLDLGVVDRHRSFLNQTDSFPNNIHVRSLLTFAPPTDDKSHADHPEARRALRPISVVVSHTLTLLPETPMQARLFDPRVGYFKTTFVDYGSADGAIPQERSIILRRRLEKKDPTADVSVPVTPIVFFIGRNVPDKWRPYMRRGVEDWQPALEAAGFKNAIVARDAPSVTEDPSWDADDSRWSVVRWVDEPIANAMGPNIHDPRSGEILSSHILVWAEVLDFAEQIYFTLAGGSDPNAGRLPLSDAVLGEALRYIVAHEVGHALGLRHNFKASQAYDVAQLRDPDFANANGPVASIMSYGRMNFVAQPGDGVTQFNPTLGPYDHFAIAWGYTPIPDAETPLDEFQTLDDWAAMQIDNPALAFGGEDMPALFDPTVLTENVGANRIEATELGLANLERVLVRLPNATTTPGGDFDKLRETYFTIIEMRTHWLTDVAKMVGGMVEHRTLAGRGGAQFVRFPLTSNAKRSSTSSSAVSSLTVAISTRSCWRSSRLPGRRSRGNAPRRSSWTSC